MFTFLGERQEQGETTMRHVVFFLVVVMSALVSFGCSEQPNVYTPIVVSEDAKIQPTGDVLKDCSDWLSTATKWYRGFGAAFGDCDYDGKWDVVRPQSGQEVLVVKNTDELIKRATERLEDAASGNRVFRDLSGEALKDRIQRGGKTNGTRDLCVPIENDPQKRHLCGDDGFIVRSSTAWKSYQKEFDNLFGTPPLVASKKPPNLR